MMKKKSFKLLGLLLAIIFILSGCSITIVDDSPIVIVNPSEDVHEETGPTLDQEPTEEIKETIISIDDIPAYNGKAYIDINNGIPFFEQSEYIPTSFEEYSPLDSLGRCGVAFACIGQDIMPTEERGSIGSVKPSGWQTITYDFVDGKYLYNRCHLIGYQLSAENANKQNLITGTRYLNIQGMLDLENEVASYVKTTNNHVLYRATPIFEGNNLVASGVLMEAASIEDSTIIKCIYAYNVQPGVVIDYLTGESHLDGEEPQTQEEEFLKYGPVEEYEDFILNVSSKKFHKVDCSGASSIKEENKELFHGPRQWLIDNGYSPCGTCKP